MKLKAHKSATLMKTVKHIVLIDDDDFGNEYQQIVFKKALPSATITVFTDSRKVVSDWNNLVQTTKPGVSTLVFLDIKMPAIDGFALLRHIKNTPDPYHHKGRFKIFMISTADSSFYQKELESVSDMIEGFYTKPVTEKILQEIMEKHF